MPGFQADIIPLPSRLKMMDSGALSFLSISHFSVNWNIFQDFLDSDHPLALDGQRHAAAASACLKIIFIYDQAPHSQRTLKLNPLSQRHRPEFKPQTLWHRSVRHWHLRNYPSSRKPHKFPRGFLIFQPVIRAQRVRSAHLKFLLEKSAYSDNLLNFARRRVFRFGYLQRSHPTYLKMAIFALAKYIHRVTRETAEVRACELIWGRQRWFTEN